MLKYQSPIPASALTRKPKIGYLSRFLQPRKWAGEPVLAWHRFMVLSKATVATLMSTAKRIEVRHLRFIYQHQKKTAVKEKGSATPMIKGSGTVLLIDDEQMIVDLGCELLEELGYSVTPAMSGDEAINIFSSNKEKIDLVIMDMIMPGMGGGETFDRLREIDPGIKVLLSSGYSIDGQATKILRRGCNGFIQKPFKLNQLAEKIQKIMGNPH